MYTEQKYRELAYDFVTDEAERIAQAGDEDTLIGIIIDLMWLGYEQGYQDRIDDFDGMEEDEGLSDWERNR